MPEALEHRTYNFDGDAICILDLWMATSVTHLRPQLNEGMPLPLKRSLHRRKGLKSYRSAGSKLRHVRIGCMLTGVSRQRTRVLPQDACAKASAFSIQYYAVFCGDEVTWRTPDGREHVCKALGGQLPKGSNSPHCVTHRLCAACLTDPILPASSQSDLSTNTTANNAPRESMPSIPDWTARAHKSLFKGSYIRGLRRDGRASSRACRARRSPSRIPQLAHATGPQRLSRAA